MPQSSKRSRSNSSDEEYDTEQNMSTKKRSRSNSSDNDTEQKAVEMIRLFNLWLNKEEKKKRERAREKEREKKRDKKRREKELEREREIDRARERERELDRSRERARELERELARERDSELLNRVAAYHCIVDNMQSNNHGGEDLLIKDIRKASKAYAIQHFRFCGLCTERFDGFKFGAHTQVDGKLLITKSNKVICHNCVYNTAIKSFDGNFGSACKYLMHY